MRIVVLHNETSISLLFLMSSNYYPPLPGPAYFQNLLSFPFSSLHRISAQLHPRPPSPVSVPLSLPPDDADCPSLCPHPCTLTPCPVTVPRSPAARIVFPPNCLFAPRVRPRFANNYCVYQPTSVHVCSFLQLFGFGLDLTRIKLSLKFYKQTKYESLTCL